jgi:hypothetical protein
VAAVFFFVANLAAAIVHAFAPAGGTRLAAVLLLVLLPLSMKASLWVKAFRWARARPLSSNLQQAHAT